MSTPQQPPSGERNTILSVHPAFTIGKVEARLFGSFVEHLGRGVYGGLFDPSHPTADSDGLRQDVIELVRELGVTTVRYPGGNFVSGYDWRDGVGPIESRPRRLDPAWHSVETNRFGTDEFALWCRRAGVEPMLAVNLGTAGVRDALHLLEYVNHPGGTALSDARRSMGAEQPYDIRIWCLGNEMDGQWQVGHKSARDYGALASATGAAMRAIDPNLEIVVCGSSHERMPTFGLWEREVLEATLEVADYISCHQYFRNEGDLTQFLRSGLSMDSFIESIAATIRHVQAVTHSTRVVGISFDEWNVWDWASHDQLVQAGSLGWDVAPRLLEERYTVADAVVVGGMLISLLNHADVVHAASMAQLVNAIGPIVAEPGMQAWRQTTFFPFADARRSAGRTALQVAVGADHTQSSVAAAATIDEDTGHLDIYLVQRDPAAADQVTIDLRAFGKIDLLGGSVLHETDPMRGNTSERPELVKPRTLVASLEDSVLTLELLPVSWAAVRLRVVEDALPCGASR